MTPVAELPAADQLQRLPLRAIVAYAYRSASRVAVALHQDIPSDIVSNALGFAERFVAERDIRLVDAADALLAAACVAKASEISGSPLIARASLSVTSATESASLAILAAFSDPKNSRGYQAQAAIKAARSARLVDALEEPAAAVALLACLRDFRCFVDVFGEYDTFMFGEPFDPSEIAGVA